MGAKFNFYLVQLSVVAVSIFTVVETNAAGVMGNAVSVDVLSFVNKPMHNLAPEYQVRGHKPEGNANDNDTEVEVHLKCHDNKNFGSQNKVAAGGIVNIRLTYPHSDGLHNEIFSLNVPSKAFMRGNEEDDDHTSITMPNGSILKSGVLDLDTNTIVVTEGTVKRHGNCLKFKLPNSRSNKLVAVTQDYLGGREHGGNVDDPVSTINSIGAIRSGNFSTAGTGQVGPMEANVESKTSEDGKHVDIDIDVPGDSSYCSEKSEPLMLFFNDKMPLFTELSAFPLLGEASLGNIRYFWPERSSKGYFLAIDDNKNGKIDSGAELFGDQGKFPTGYDKLMSYDLNKDGVIDSKDEVFKHLVLFRSNNWSPKKTGTIVPISSLKIEQLSLKQVPDIRYFSNRANTFTKSDFIYFDKNNLKKTGNMYEVFLKKVIINSADKK
jgi:hypothetical protein